MHSKKATINPHLRTAVWDRYIGPGVKTTTCHLCGITEISLNGNNGFECAHLVAENNGTPLTTFYLYPSCRKCNSECRTSTVFDYMYARERWPYLCALIWKLYCAFEMQHPTEIAHLEYSAWRVLDHLYGPRQFPLGGGIRMRLQIYELAKSEQSRQLTSRMHDLTNEIAKLSAQMQQLLETPIVIAPPKFI